VQGFKGAKFQKFQALQDAEHFVSSSTDTAAQIKVSSSSLVISYETPPSSSTPSPNPSPTKRAGPNAKTYYAVAKGKTVGIFLTWKECQAQVNDVPYPKFRKFYSLEEAEAFIAEHTVTPKEKNRQLMKQYPVTKARVQQVRHLSTATFANDRFPVNSNGFVEVYTDGACENNGKPTAKAGIGVWFGHNHPMNVSEPVKGPNTNNVAEIEAATKSIQVAKSCGITKLQINTDSQFLIRCINDWLPKWKSNGWKKSDGGDVINKVQLEDLVRSKADMEIKWNYVPGHRGIEGNEGADKLARDGVVKTGKSTNRFKPY